MRTFGAGALMAAWVLIGCEAGGAEYAEPQAVVAPSQEVGLAGDESLPFKGKVWEYRFRDTQIKRLTIGVENLYLETPDNRVAAVDRHTGVMKWVYQIPSNTPLDYPPAEAPQVITRIREKEAEVAAAGRLKRDIEKEEGASPRAQEALRRYNQLRQELNVAFRGDNVYLVTRHTIHCIVRTTGNVPWYTTLGFPPSAAPYPTQDAAFLPAADQPRVWRLNIDRKGEYIDFYPASVTSTGDRTIITSPVVDEDRLYFVSSDGYAYAFDVSSRDLKWAYKAHDKLLAGPVVHHRRERYKDKEGRISERVRRYLFFGGLDGSLYALDAGTGQIEWKFETAGVLKTAPVVKDETVYVATEDGALFALELDPQHRDPKNGESLGTNRMGRLRWKLPLGERFLVKGSGGAVLVLGPDSEIYKLDEMTGAVLGRFPLGEFTHVATNAMEGTLYVATDSGYVAALRESAEKF